MVNLEEITWLLKYIYNNIEILEGLARIIKEIIVYINSNPNRPILPKKVSDIHTVLGDGNGPNRPDPNNVNPKLKPNLSGLTKENIEDMLKELTKWKGKNKTINQAGISNLTFERLQRLQSTMDPNLLGRSPGGTRINSTLIDRLNRLINYFK